MCSAPAKALKSSTAGSRMGSPGRLRQRGPDSGDQADERYQRHDAGAYGRSRPLAALGGQPRRFHGAQPEHERVRMEERPHRETENREPPGPRGLAVRDGGERVLGIGETVGVPLTLELDQQMFRTFEVRLVDLDADTGND